MNDVLSLLSAELRRLVAPLALAAHNDVARAALFNALGWDLDSLTGFPVNDLVTALGAIAADVEALASAAESPPQGLTDITNLTSRIGQNIDAIRALSSLASNPAISAPTAVTDALANLGDELFEFLLCEYLLRYRPTVLQALQLLTLASPPDSITPGIDGPSGKPMLRYPTARASVNLDRLPALLKDPLGTLHGAYLAAGMSTPAAAQATANTIFRRLAPLLATTGATVIAGIDQPDAPTGLDPQRAISMLYGSPDSTVSTGIGALVQLIAQAEGGPGLSVTPAGVVSATWNLPTWTIDLTVTGTIGQFQLLASGATMQPGAEVSLSLSVEYLAVDGVPAAVIGVPLGTSVKIGSAAIAGTVSVSGSGQQTGVELRLSKCVIAVASSDGDGFLAAVLPPDGLTINFDVDFGWSKNRGLYLGAGTGLTCTIPVGSLVAGVVLVDSVALSLTPGDTGEVALAFALTGGLALGPFAVSVQNLGVDVQLSFPAGGGNLGPANLDRLGFKPPDGLGLALDADPVSGGGFLAFDAAYGRYLGAVALQFGPVSVQGVAVLSTKVPGVGWSLVALADVGGLSVQLGFGIELTGVGLLVAAHRTMNVAGLQALARAGQLETVLFPADLAENGPRVAADLDSLFPPAAGEFVVGPIVQLAWGTSSLVTAELAIFIEFPHQVRVAVLGVVQILLPEADDPVADLQLDVLGVLDLSAKTVALDMSLTHSSIAGMPLTGQAAFRGSWGADPAFLLAIGGLNPHFTPPSGFPSLQRIGLVFGKADLMIRLSSYLALSANTLQFGAAVDLRADAGPAALTATASFDALLQFKPFHLELDVAIRAAITLHGNAVMALDVAAHLSGPGPWQLAGKVRFAVLCFSFTIPISGTFGGAARQIAPAVVDVLPQLVQALSAASNWTLNAPAGPGVLTLRGGVAETALHPLGGLTLRQRVVPLEIPIDRFGADILPASTTLSVTAPNPAGGQAIRSQSGIDTDLFAPGQYMTMTDAQRISEPSFEPLASGLTISSADVVVAGHNGIAASEADAAQFTPSSKQWDPPTVIDDFPAGPVVPTAAGATAGTAVSVAVPAALIGAQLASSAAAAASAVPYRAPPSSSRAYGLRLPTYTFVWSANLSLHATYAEAAAAASAAAAGVPIQYLSELPGQAGT